MCNSINKTPWSVEENHLLKNLLVEHNIVTPRGQDKERWKSVALKFREVYPDRTYHSIVYHIRDSWAKIHKLSNAEIRNRPWTHEDQKVLLIKIEEYKNDPNMWDKIGADLGRTSVSVRIYYQQTLLFQVEPKVRARLQGYTPKIQPPKNVHRVTAHPGASLNGWDDEKALRLIKLVTDQPGYPEKIDWPKVRDEYNQLFPERLIPNMLQTFDFRPSQSLKDVGYKTLDELRHHWDNTLYPKYKVGQTSNFYERLVTPWDEVEKEFIKNFFSKNSKPDFSELYNSFKKEFPESQRTLNQLKCQANYMKRCGQIK